MSVFSAAKMRRPESLAAAREMVAPVIWLPDERDTYRLGHVLGEIACAGDTLLLDGDLGAGKTCLARGYIHSARRDPTLQVTSPTYLLVNTYSQTPPPMETTSERVIPTIYHMDLWRLQDASTRPIVDFDHLFSHAIALIEWPDRLGSKALPEERLHITLRYPAPLDDPNMPAQNTDRDAGNDIWGFEAVTRQGRTATLTPHGKKWIDRVKSLCESRMQQNDLQDSVQYTLTDHAPR